ncbi:hypothetical protein GIB67_016944 [Kingdonia uniflora]|uniref:Microtubule-associated protein n=1 Tax=Kingdonia uniflora TaxID=39325 RepID=A0A7J7M3I8_9MAGN|nr:hypothetical protein GIB67_016944 [Kingdonia uniflora]
MSDMMMISPSISLGEITTCGSLLQELQICGVSLVDLCFGVFLGIEMAMFDSMFRKPETCRFHNTCCDFRIWDEIGESDSERDKMLLQLEQECLDVYRRKVEKSSKYKAELHQSLAEAESEVANLVSALGERASFLRPEKTGGTLKEQMSAIKPTLEDLRRKREERVKDFQDVQLQIARLSGEIGGNVHLSKSTDVEIDEKDLTVTKLGELKLHLEELQGDKSIRLQKVNAHVRAIHELSVLMSVDFYNIISEVHPSLGDSTNTQAKSISDETLTRLASVFHSLEEEKEKRLRKLQDLGSTLIELWNLMDTPVDEQKRFDHVTSLISASVGEVSRKESLALDVIEQTELEIERLNVLKASKIKELVLNKQHELEEIYRGVHMDVNTDTARQTLINLIDSGLFITIVDLSLISRCDDRIRNVDMSDLLSGMDDQIAKAKEQAASRKDILDRVEKWKYSSEEESWLDDYELDHNRYSAGRGAHKNLKRAEKARILVSKIPSLVENLTAKVKAWEDEKGMLFLYNKDPLLENLREYSRHRQEREEEKRRSREKKRLQEQFATEQEAIFGSRPSPLRPVKKPLGPANNSNIGTPQGRNNAVTPLSRHGKERSKVGGAVIPVNYVALPKDSPHAVASP